MRDAGFDFDTGITVSNGGLNAPLPDMAKYLPFLLSDGSNAIYEAVLKRASLSHLYLHRPSHTAYVIAFNTDVNRASASVTRQVDAAVRDAIIREIIPHR